MLVKLPVIGIMDIITLTESNFMFAVEEASRILKKGGIIVFPTDTVYGLGGDALKSRAVKKIFKIKKREAKKPLPVMVRDIEMARQFSYFDSKIEKVLNEVWPGAVTVILKKRSNVLVEAACGENTIGFRIPAHEFCEALIEKYSRPITLTSANISGSPSATNLEEILRDFRENVLKPDLIIEERKLSSGQASTVLDLTRPSPRITRLGPVSKKDLLNILNK